MKYAFLLIAGMVSSYGHAIAQTISYSNPQEATPPLEIKDVNIKGKVFNIPKRPELLSVRVNSEKDFKTKATDADNKDIPLDPSSGNRKSGTAILSFLPGSPTTEGTIKQGTATDGSQVIKVNVTVGTKGFYTAYTDIKNGLQFAASGYLEEGTTVITLKAIGTPLTAGSHSYTIKAAGVTTTANLTVDAGTAVTNATFTIEKTGPNCTTFKIDGKLTVSKALADEDKLTVKINAATTGYYIISTPVVNGYYYIATGLITNTGVQDVILKGKGMPLTSGNDKITITDGANSCEGNLKVDPAGKDYTDYNIVDEVTKIEFIDPDNDDKFTIEIPAKKVDDDDDDDENADVLLGGSSVYEDAIFNTYGRTNLVLTPYGLMLNTRTAQNKRTKDKPYIYGGPNYVHIFLDEMGNSLITGIPQGMPEVQYVVHVLYVEKSDGGKKVSYGIKTTKASFTGVSRIENNRNVDAQTSSSEGTAHLREYTLVIRTADSDIDFEVYRFENGKQMKGTLSYTIPMTRSFTANISAGLLCTWLKDPTFSLETDPTNSLMKVAKQTEGNSRGFGTVFATLYTSPITIIKYYVNRGQMKKGRKQLSDINNPVTNAQLHSKNYLYMRPVWERIYPTVGVGISDKVFQNLFFGLNWEFARGGSFFAGGHYGKVNIFNRPNEFKFEKTNLSQEEFDLYSNKDWKIGWTIGASIDFSIIGNLFK